MLLHSKVNHQQNKNTTYGMGKNIWKQCDQQGVNIQNTQTVHTTQYRKNKQPIKNWAEELNRYFPKRKCR